MRDGGDGERVRVFRPKLGVPRNGVALIADLGVDSELLVLMDASSFVVLRACALAVVVIHVLFLGCMRLYLILQLRLVMVAQARTPLAELALRYLVLRRVVRPPLESRFIELTVG